jgi:hypothetical protein
MVMTTIPVLGWIAKIIDPAKRNPAILKTIQLLRRSEKETDMTRFANLSKFDNQLLMR